MKAAALIKHGTDSGYVNSHCRCDKCTAAHAAYQRRWIARQKLRPVPASVPHGTKQTYTNYGCRCEPCTAANKAACAAGDARRRAAEKARIRADLAARGLISTAAGLPAAPTTRTSASRADERTSTNEQSNP